MGQLLAPARGGLTKAGGFDLVVHFHGHEAIRKEVVRAARGVVLVGIDVGVGSGAYASAFSAPHVFEDLLRSVEQEMARRNDRKRAVVRHLALSSWSAGYGAIAQILRQPAGKKVDAVVLLDSLHAGYAGGNALKDADLEPFVAFARRAARGEKLLFQSHSSIVPPGYASTREVSHHVVGKLGGKVREARRSDVLGLELFERFDQRGYHVRGYRGDDKPDHCAHIGLMRDVVRAHLGPRWSPPAMKAPRAAGGERVTAKGRVHVVAPGESLIGIAKRYGLDARGLRERNGLRKGEPIQPGQELLLTGAPSAAAKAKKGGAGAAGKAAGRVHVVAEGQSLRKIARRYRVTVDAIVQANGLKRGEPIHPGQSLVIPERGARPRKPKAGSAERGAPTKAAANDGPRDEKPPAAGGSTATAAHAPADADHDDPGD
jgi:LysM repeat protein